MEKVVVHLIRVKFHQRVVAGGMCIMTKKIRALVKNGKRQLARICTPYNTTGPAAMLTSFSNDWEIISCIILLFSSNLRWRWQDFLLDNSSVLLREHTGPNNGRWHSEYSLKAATLKLRQAAPWAKCKKIHASERKKKRKCQFHEMDITCSCQLPLPKTPGEKKRVHHNYHQLTSGLR